MNETLTIGTFAFGAAVLRGVGERFPALPPFLLSASRT